MIFRKKLALLCCLFLSFFILTGLEAKSRIHDEQDVVKRHLLVILVPEFSFIELEPLLTSLPVDFQAELHLAGISMRTGGAVNLNNNLLSLATGYQASAPAQWNAYELEDELRGRLASELYQQWGGVLPTTEIIHPAIFRLQTNWIAQGDFRLKPGWLGQALAQQGITTLALGNSDVHEQRQRSAPSFIMNEQGEAQGEIGSQILSTAPFFPTGQKTDWLRLSVLIQRTWQETAASFIVAELGDLRRINSQKNEMTAERVQQVTTEWLTEWSAWLEELRSESQRLATLAEIWVLSPMVSSEARRQGQMLAPFIQWTNAGEGGLLTSQTTKQAGIIANIDVAPSILNYFSLEVFPTLPGRVIMQDESHTLTVQNESELYRWFDELTYLFTIYKSRGKIITAYIMTMIILLVSVAIYWWWAKQRPQGKGIARLILRAIPISPLYFLWPTPLISSLSTYQWLAFLLLFSLISSWLLAKLCRTEALRLGLIGLLNTVVIVADLFRGSVWMKRSFLGYDPLIGARFYGLGNEYAGILLGSSLLGVVGLYVWLVDKGYFTGKNALSRKRIYILGTSLYYLVLLYMMAAPQFGTNAGATLASVFTYLAAQLFLFSIRWSWKNIIIISLGLVTLGAGFILLHLYGEQTHIGSLLNTIMTGDWTSVLALIERKLSMNLKLIRVSLWGKLFVVSLLVLVFFLFRVKNRQLRQDLWFQGFRVIILGALLILVVNDSGIVAAATTMMYVTFPFLYLRFSEKRL